MKLVLNSLITVLICACSFDSLKSQDGILYNSDMSQEGYVLCTHDFNTFLIDQCGQIVNTWSAWNIDYHAKLTDEGNIYYLDNGKIYERDWEDNIVVEIEHNVTGLRLVYDIVKMKNGNYLVNCRWSISSSEIEELGWDENLGGFNLIDGIVEINPEGEVVWSWNIKEHTVQDQIEDATNFGSVEDNPQLMNIRAISDFDWKFGEAFMFNGIDYNEELDLILISVRKMSEFIIIDHSTTTEEAASNIGGDYDKGGDILYRWGNPKNYQPNTIVERQLFYQHNPNWIKYGDHEGSIIVFNNGLSTNTGSSVIIVNPDTDDDGNFIMIDSTFSPTTPERKIDSEKFDSKSSGYTSGAKVMENGNIYITSGNWDQFIEITPDDEIAWNYKLEGNRYTYRTEKYPPSHPGLADKDFSVEGTIESPPSNYECTDFTTSTTDITKNDIRILHDPIGQTISFQTRIEERLSINGFDLMGRKIFNEINLRSEDNIDVSQIKNQIIILNIKSGQNQSITKKVYIH